MSGHLKARRLTGVRQELKYLLTPAEGPRFREAISSRIPVKLFNGFDHSYRISIYLDTDDFTMAARALIQGTQTTKLRAKKYYQIEKGTPIYDDIYWLEAKTRAMNMVEKVRFKVSESQLIEVLAKDALITGNTAEEDQARRTFHDLRLHKPLRPIFVTHYRRFTFQDEASTVRITLDDACSVHLPPVGLFTPAVPICARRYLPPPLFVEPHWILEVKTTGMDPEWLAELTSTRSTADYSKFVTGVHALQRAGKLLRRS